MQARTGGPVRARPQTGRGAPDLAFRDGAAPRWRAGSYRGDIHLPDAPAVPSAGIRQLSDLRHGAGTVAARQFGIDDVHADLLSDDKHRIVATLKADGKVVFMAGDDVNDGPALAVADFGMGTGTEVAIQSVGIILLNGDLASIARALRLRAIRA